MSHPNAPTGDEAARLTFLGTAAAVPGVGHDTASFLIGRRILVDAGWNAALRMRIYGFNPMDLEYLVLTHCHHDHYLGLPQLLYYLRARRSERPGRSPLRIVGPAEDLERVVDLAREFLQVKRFREVDCPVQLLPLHPGDEVDEPRFRLTTCASLHAVPGLCYRYRDKATGAEFAFTGDTAYHSRIVELVRDVPLLIHEASFGAEAAPRLNPARHSGAPDAARVAREAGVGHLALVHCPEERQAAALAAARALFPNTFWPEDGETVVLDHGR